MAALKILRPPTCGDSARETPRAQWATLIEERANFCKNVLPSDCRLLLFFIEDAQKSDWMGFDDREGYLRDGLKLNPEMVKLALRGLELSDPDRAIGYDRAIILGRHGGDRRSEKVKDQVRNTHLKGDGSVERTIARLKKCNRLDLAEKVIAGELSANAAAIEAGFRKKLTPFQQIAKLLPKLTDDELRQVMASAKAMLQ